MIRKLRLKFVAICMALVTAVLAAVLFSMFVAIQRNVRDLSRELLFQVMDQRDEPNIHITIGGSTAALLPYFTVNVYTTSGGSYLAGGTGGTSSSGTTGGISADKARSIALTDAGISESDALGLRVKQDWDEGVALYEVEFRSGGAEYEYDIRLSDGAILKSERDADNNYTYFAASSGSGALIGEAAAKTAALQHAGVSESQTSYLSCQLEYDDGRLECYEVEFRSGSTEYEYEIGPYDGAIWKAERETHGSAAAAGASAAISGNTAGGSSSAGTASGNTSSSVSSFISAEAAKAAALSHAGVSTAQVREMECKLDEDDGIDVYEIEFKSAQMEYEYEIDAYTGAILKAEQEWD